MRPTAIIAILLFASTAAADYVGAGIKARCASKWPTDYEMQKYCRDSEFAAAAKVAKFIEKHPEGTEERRILERCQRKWATQWEMVVYCTKSQLEAYRALD